MHCRRFFLTSASDNEKGYFGLTSQDLQLHFLSMGYVVFGYAYVHNKEEIVPDLGDQERSQYKKNIYIDLLHGTN